MGASDRRGDKPRRELFSLAERVNSLEKKINSLSDRFDKKLGGDTTYVSWIGKRVSIIDTNENVHNGDLVWVGKFHLGIQLPGKSESAVFNKSNLIKVELLRE